MNKEQLIEVINRLAEWDTEWESAHGEITEQLNVDGAYWEE